MFYCLTDSNQKNNKTYSQRKGMRINTMPSAAPTTTVTLSNPACQLTITWCSALPTAQRAAWNGYWSSVFTRLLPDAASSGGGFSALATPCPGPPGASCSVYNPNTPRSIYQSL